LLGFFICNTKVNKLEVTNTAVQIDECLVAHRKYNREILYSGQVSAFSYVARGTNKKSY